MLLSMTGYGKASAEYKNKKITVEVKSLNSKQADISLRLPNSYREKELDIRSLLAQKLIRGKIDCAISVDDQSTTPATTLNQSLLDVYYKQLKEASDALGLPQPDNWLELLLRMPNVFHTETTEIDEEELDTLMQAADAAIEAAIAFRRQEGAVLERMFNEKIGRIGSLLEAIEPFETERVAKIKIRLEENLKQIEERVALDRNRLEQELIFYIEKLDVNEEKLRLRNHLTYFIATMKDNAAGKKLGFISQEIGREVNTLGSKSNQSDMQKIVVEMKDELEQIKEQVLNVL